MLFKPDYPNALTAADEAAALYKRISAAPLCASAFISVDRKWCVTYWNKGAERIFNVTSTEMIGKNLWERFYAIIPLEFYGFYDRVFISGASFQFSYFWAEMNTWMDINTFSDPDGFSLALKTHEAPAGDELYDQSRFLYPIYRFITESKQECLWNWKTGSGERFWIDGGLRKLFGYHVDNTFLPQAFWENRIHPEDQERVRASIRQFVNSHEHNWQLHYRFRKADGTYLPVYETGLKFFNDQQQTEEVIGAMYIEMPEQHAADQSGVQRTRREKEIAGAILSAQETERHDIGYKLNEDLNQILAISKVYIQLAMTNAGSQEIYLQKAGTLIDQVIIGIRHITEEILMPSSKLMGLFQNLETLCINNFAAHQQKTRFTHSGFRQEELDEGFQFGIFRIIQEQIREISTGQGAKNIHIDLHRKGDRLILRVSDDRNPGDLAAEWDANGFTNIQSRAGIYNGIVSLKQEAGDQCVLTVDFPMAKEKRQLPVSLHNHFL